MAVRIEEKIVVYSSVTDEAIMTEHLWLEEQDIRDYLKKNQMPEDPNYTTEDLIYDLMNSSGMYTLDSSVKPQTGEYISRLLESLV